MNRLPSSQRHKPLERRWKRYERQQPAATPRLNGEVERSHRIEAEEFYRLLDGQVIDDARVFNEHLAEWETYYNQHRPHGALGGRTPYERLRVKTQPTGTR